MKLWSCAIAGHDKIGWDKWKKLLNDLKAEVFQ
jgi:hypothetical protein